MAFTHLLFPVISTADGKEQLQGVTRLAASLTARLTLLRVLDPFRDGGPRPAGQEAASMEAESHGVENSCVHVHSHSDPAASIAEFAMKQRVDGIVLPKHKWRWMPDMFRRREMVRRLAGESSCPLWLMGSREEEAPAPPIRRVLCAVSGRDHKVLDTAAKLCREMNAKLFVLHVVPEVHEGTLAFGFDQHIALSAENALELLAAMQAECGTDGQPVVEIGDKNRCISRAAHALRADLVVTGRRKKQNKTPPMWSIGRGNTAIAPQVTCESLVV